MQIKAHTLLAVLILLIAMVLPTAFADSSPTDLVISEVLYDAVNTSEENYEWIEIKNKGTGNIAITSSWQLCDSAACNNFPGTQTIEPGQYWLIVQRSDTAPTEVGLTGTYNASRTIVMGTGNWESLGNTKDVVRIYNGAAESANLMDCVSWGVLDTECTSDTGGGGGYGGGTDTTKSGAGNGQSISKIGVAWNYSKQVPPSQTYGGTPYLLNIWTDDTTSITLSSFGARSQQITAQPEHALATISAWPMAALGVIGLAAIGVGIVVLQRRRTA